MSVSTGCPPSESCLNDVAAKLPHHGAQKDFIHKLPTELVEYVAENVSPKDLVALRSTCRAMAAMTMRVFTLVHFSEKAFLLSNEPSMNALLAISEHPILSKKMKKISLHTLLLRPQRQQFQDVTERLSANGCHPESMFGVSAQIKHEQGRPSDAPEDSRALRRALRHAWQKYNLIRDEQVERARRSSWKPVLIQSLKNLAAPQRKVEVAMAWQELASLEQAGRRMPCGTLALEREVGLNDILTAKLTRFWPAMYVVKKEMCQLLSDASFRTLGIKGTDTTIAFVTQVFATSTPTTLDMFSQLVSLSLKLELMYKARDLLFLLRRLPSVEKLEMRGPAKCAYKMYNDEFLSTTDMPALREIKISRMTLSLGALVQFARRHGKTLQVVRVEGLGDVPAEGLEDACRRVARQVRSDQVIIEIVEAIAWSG